MLKRSVLVFAALAGGVVAAEPAPQPVFIVLYSRFYDHSHQHTTDERVQRLLPMLDRLRAKYPQSGINALFQFSGTVSQLLAEENPGLHLVDKLKESAARGLVDIGYTGEEEPSYLYRPKPELLSADTPEKRWAARFEAGDRFLNDYKNPLTGKPVPGLTGGLKRTLEVFGSASFVTGISTGLGGETPVVHGMRKMAPAALMSGIPPSDPKRGIEGYGFSANNFSQYLSPDPRESPEVFWEDNVLRVSDASLTDNKPHTADEDVDALKKVFGRLDRSHPRVIKLEVASYLRYLTKRVDGSVLIDPMEWIYYHPDNPRIPANMKPLLTQTDVEAGYKKDEATLSWLLAEFLPANPGSRFISARELAKMAAPRDTEIGAGDVKALAEDIERQFGNAPMVVPNYAQAGNRYFTLAESFAVLAQALAGGKGGVRMPEVYGPIEIPDANMGLPVASVKVRDVMEAAARVAPKLASREWKVVPDNSVPANVQAGSVKLNAGQFLRMMAQAYLEPNPDKSLSANAVQMFSTAAFMYPKNTPMSFQSNSWTFKPAPLNVGTLTAGK